MPKRHQTGKWSLLSQRQRMSPFPNYMSMESVCREMKKFVGTSIRDILLFFQGNIMFCFQNTKVHEKAARFISDKVQRDPLLYKRLVRQEEHLGGRLVRFTEEAGKAAKKPASNQKLCHFFATYEKYYKDVYASYGSVWTMEDELMSDLLKIIELRIKDSKEAIDALNVLTAQPRAMVATIERQALLSLALKISKKDDWKKIILRGEVEGIKKYKQLHQLVSAHQKKFFWITRDYEDPILTYEDVVARLKKYLMGGAGEEYKELIKQLSDFASKKKQYEKKLKLSKRELALFSAMRDAAYLKELRKKFISQSLYYFDPVLAEIGRRLFMSVRQVRFLSTADAKEALLHHKDLNQEINDRIKLSMWRIFDGTKTVVTTGPKAEKMFAKFCLVDKHATEFIGMPVSPGIARGPAKLVMNPNECSKVKKGDIIVSIQVVPSFSTAILKAAGLICDGGHGITSHPATLAREAGIPCVIQTRFAREVLKDGDMVEVDGYKGIARKIK